MVTDVKKLPIQFDRDRVVAFCRDRGIVRLSVFGSVLRDDFVVVMEVGKCRIDLGWPQIRMLPQNLFR